MTLERGSQKKAAEFAGVHPSTISRHLRNGDREVAHLAKEQHYAIQGNKTLQELNKGATNDMGNTGGDSK